MEELLRHLLVPARHETLLDLPGQDHLELLTQGHTTYGVTYAGSVTRHYAAFVLKTNLGDFTVTVSKLKGV
jgi:hypothetical protein